MERHFCPICNSELKVEHKIKYIDYYCHNYKDHSFGKRIIQENKKLNRVKIRLTDNKDKLYIQIYYQDGYLEVWKNSSIVDRAKVNYTFVPDYSDIKSLKNKIKTYMVFN